MKNPFNFLNKKQHEFAQPKSWQQEILLTLILKGKVSLVDFPKLSGYRTRVSELREMGIKTKDVKVYFTSRFGNKSDYIEHHLLNKEFAESLYKELTDEKSKRKTGSKE